MKRFATLLLSAFLVLGLASVNAMADAAKGQKYYLKFMKDGAGLNGADFAHQHTQAEWEALFDADAKKFIDEYSTKFPKLKDFLNGDKFKKFMPHIKDFVIEFASDSGKVPSC
ncbi:MAG: hypothetical protein K5978_01580 [Campylobacter sp.]|nr:hypothetical protein [Campylobacter sp.]